MSFQREREVATGKKEGRARDRRKMREREKKQKRRRQLAKEVPTTEGDAKSDTEVARKRARKANGKPTPGLFILSI
jgi:hypothetical protein